MCLVAPGGGGKRRGGWLVHTPLLSVLGCSCGKKKICARKPPRQRAGGTEPPPKLTAVEDAYRRPIEAIVGVVRATTPIGAATRVIRGISNRVTARITIGTLARRARAPSVVVIGTDRLEGLTAVFRGDDDRLFDAEAQT